MGFDSQPQVVMSLLPEVRKMAPLGSWEQASEGRWLLSNHQKPSYSMSSFLDT